MRGDHDVMAVRQRVHLLDVADEQPAAPRPQSRLGRPQHGGGAVKKRQRQSRSDPLHQRLGKGTVASTKVDGRKRAGRWWKTAKRLGHDRAVGCRKAQPRQPPPPVRGGGIIARG